MIYDQSTGKWYEVYRDFRGKLKLKEVVFKGSIRFLTEGDFFFSKSKLRKVVLPPEPATPQ